MLRRASLGLPATLALPGLTWRLGSPAGRVCRAQGRALSAHVPVALARLPAAGLLLLLLRGCPCNTYSIPALSYGLGLSLHDGAAGAFPAYPLPLAPTGRGCLGAVSGGSLRWR